MHLRKTCLPSLRLPEKHEDEGALPTKHKDERTSSPSTPHADLRGMHEDGHTLSPYERFMAAASDDGAIDYESFYHLY